MSGRSLHLATGALSASIAAQVAKQGLFFKGGDGAAAKFQRAADAITYLVVHGYIAQKAADIARQRLVRNVADAVFRADPKDAA